MIIDICTVFSDHKRTLKYLFGGEFARGDCSVYKGGVAGRESSAYNGGVPGIELSGRESSGDDGRDICGVVVSRDDTLLTFYWKPVYQWMGKFKKCTVLYQMKDR